MNFRVAVRAFHQYRAHCFPNACSRRWLSVSPNDESWKSSVTIGGKTIKYVRSGEGEHAVLCLPGALGSSLTDFKPQIEGLNQKAFTVIAWDPPGYGHSRPPNRDFSPGFLNRDADYAVGLMKALNLPKFSVLGWSDGGITGIILAAKYPQNVKKMAIWGANAYITDEEIGIFKKIRDVRTWSEKMRAPMIELYGEELFQTMWDQWVDEFERIHREDEGDICTTELKSIQCPLFVLHGKKDAVVLPEHPQYIVDNVPDSQLYTFEEGKHNIHLRYAEEFNSLVHKFLMSEQSSGTADHNVSFRLPRFLSKSPASWFAQVEACFHLTGIKDDLTKFNCVLPQLDREYLELVQDVVCNPPGEGKYNLLKTELINRLKGKRLHQWLSNVKIGDKKPSEFLNHLRDLAGDEASDSLLHPIWLEGLPGHVKAAVTTQSAPLGILAELADVVAEFRHESTSIVLPLIERSPDAISKQLTVRSRSSQEGRGATLLEKHVTSYKTGIRSHDKYIFNNVVSISDAPMYDVNGWPLPGSITPKDIMRGVQLTSKYHLLLTDFPGVLYSSELPQAEHHETRHRILIKSTAKRHPFRFHLSEGETIIARNIIHSMIRQGTARASTSPLAGDLKLFRDEVPDAPGWHAFGDYQYLNAVTASDSYKTRHVVEISDSLWGCNVFSVVNLRRDWTRIPMAPECISKTAVLTTFGKFEFPFMPQGLLNSYKTWQKVLDKVLQGLPYCFGRIDGILVFSRNHDEHLQHIRALFQRLSQNGIFVNVSKSVFGQANVNFFNYSISTSGCSPIPEKVVKALVTMQAPQDYLQLDLFLRTTALYRRYIPVCLETPLKVLQDQRRTSENAPILWNPELEQAFQRCKSALSRATLHSKPDPFSNLSISVSTARFSVGAVLNQETINGLVPLAFFSKMLPDEGLDNPYLPAVYESLKEFFPFVGGRDFILYVNFDSAGSVFKASLNGKSNLNYRVNYCSQFNMDIKYVERLDNVVPHCLAALYCERFTMSVDTDSSTDSSDDTQVLHHFSSLI